LATGDANADEALARDLVLEDVEWASGEVLPRLGTVTLVDLMLRQGLLRLEDYIVRSQFFWSKLREIDLLVLAALIIIFCSRCGAVLGF